MALIQKHKNSFNQSSEILTVTETTGVFSTTNIGGYGATQTPTGRRGIAQITNGRFTILDYNGSVSFDGVPSLNPQPIFVDELYTNTYSQAEAQSLANQISRTYDLSTLIGTNFIDGVYKTVYYNIFNGFDVIARATANQFVYGEYAEFENAKYLIVSDGLTFYPYEILSVQNVSGAAIITVNADIPEDLSGDMPYTVFYSSTNYFANTSNINKCLHSKISQLSLSNCSCKTKSTEKLYEAVMMYMSIQPNMDLGKYTKAQEIILALTKYCTDGSCNC